MSPILRSLVLAAVSTSALALSTSALADRGKWRDDDDDRHGRWEQRYRYDDDRRWVPPGHRWKHRSHRHGYYDERVIVIQEPARVYLPPPVVYRDIRPVRPVISISVPDIIIPF